jgi:hypothetical protein
LNFKYFSASSKDLLNKTSKGIINIKNKPIKILNDSIDKNTTIYSFKKESNKENKDKPSLKLLLKLK